MTINQAAKSFAKLVRDANDEPNKRCDCCGGDLPPESAYESAREWDVDSGDCDGSVQADNGHCRAFAEIGW